MRKQISMLVWVICICILCTNLFVILVVRRTHPVQVFWSVDVERLSTFRQADPCIQAMLYIEHQPESDRPMEPFSSYRLLPSIQRFSASPSEITRCVIEIGRIVLDYMEVHPLSDIQKKQAKARLFGIVKILCNPDFSVLPSSLEVSRSRLLNRIINLQDEEYKDLRDMIELQCDY